MSSNDAREELAGKLVPHYGEVQSKGVQGKMLVVKYANGVRAFVMESLGRMETWPNGQTIFVHPKSQRFMLRGADGKCTEEYKAPEGEGNHPRPVHIPFSSLSSKPATQPATASPQRPAAASPVKPTAPAPAKSNGAQKRKVVEDSESSSDSSSSSSSDSDVIKKRPRVSAGSAKPKPAAKPTPKKTAPKKSSPRKRAAPPSTPPPPKKPEKPIDINNDAEATLEAIVLKMVEDMDLTEARATEAERVAQADAANKKAPPKPNTKFPTSIDGLEKALQRLHKKKVDLQTKLQNKDDTKEVSLGTSKTNYIDPRIIHAWCNRENVPLKKVYTQSLIVKFPWAQEADEDWRF